jgi:NSS family neurotransmitter:Na+ symporter
MGSSVLANVAPLGEGSTILDLEDRIVSVYLLPLGSLSFVIYCTWKIGWGWDNFTAEANAGAGLKIKPWMRIWCKYVLPVVILFVFVLGFIG